MNYANFLLIFLTKGRFFCVFRENLTNVRKTETKIWKSPFFVVLLRRISMIGNEYSVSPHITFISSPDVSPLSKRKTGAKQGLNEV